MQRRDFLKKSALAAGALMAAPSFSQASMMKPSKGEVLPEGPVTLYVEFYLPEPMNAKALHKIREFSREMNRKEGFLSLSLKNMVGDSTMVKNYPSNLKGVLRSSFYDAAKEGSMPLFYSLFLRFESYKALEKSGAYGWLEKRFKAHAPHVGKFFEGIFVTVAAGDRNKIYRSRKEIVDFLSHQVDHRDREYVSVNNHVSILAKNTEVFNEKSTALLKIAQDTFRPAKGDAEYNRKFPHGMPGSFQNRHYRKAVTTEILQSAFTVGNERRYLFHGTWESIYDHENSHLDVRFRQHVAVLFPYLTAMPYEPFYETVILRNRHQG